MENVKSNRGRKKFDFNKKKLVGVLENIRDGKVNLTHYMKHQLEQAGYLEFEKVKSGKRGRPVLLINITGKAKGLIALAKNWK